MLEVETQIGSAKTKSQLKELVAETLASTESFARVFFPETFKTEFNPLRKRICKWLDSSEQRVVIAAPRGLGKTTLCQVKAAQQIVSRAINYLVYVGQSESLAVAQTENLKRDLLMNEDLKRVFGSIKSKSSEAGLSEQFSKLSWVAKLSSEELGTLVLPRGAGQAVRGMKFGSKRPDFYIVDDFEDSKLIMSDENREKWKEWFYADLMMSVSQDEESEQSWRIVYIDTLKHEDALIQELLDSGDWAGEKLELCDESLKSNAPTFKSDETIRQLYEEHKKKGRLDVFAREYRNLVIAGENASFKPEFFQDFREPELPIEIQRRWRSVVLVDPAKTATMQSDDSAVVGVSLDTETNAIYVRDVVSGKFFPDELLKAMFDMVVRLGAHDLAVEVTGLDEFIKHPVKNFARVAGIHPRFHWLKARKKKEDRVAALAPYYRAGHIWHSPACTKLEQQLLGFPRSKLWDVMDCFAYAVEFFEMNQQYFEPSGGDVLMEDESVYRELENEEPLSNWGF